VKNKIKLIAGKRQILTNEILIRVCGYFAFFTFLAWIIEIKFLPEKENLFDFALIISFFLYIKKDYFEEKFPALANCLNWFVFGGSILIIIFYFDFWLNYLFHFPVFFSGKLYKTIYELAGAFYYSAVIVAIIVALYQIIVNRIFQFVKKSKKSHLIPFVSLLIFIALLAFAVSDLPGQLTEKYLFYAMGILGVPLVAVHLNFIKEKIKDIVLY
jgi:hypothetical protein